MLSNIVDIIVSSTLSSLEYIHASELRVIYLRIESHAMAYFERYVTSKVRKPYTKKLAVQQVTAGDSG